MTAFRAQQNGCEDTCGGNTSALAVGDDIESGKGMSIARTEASGSVHGHPAAVSPVPSVLPLPGPEHGELRAAPTQYRPTTSCCRRTRCTFFWCRQRWLRAKVRPISTNDHDTGDESGGQSAGTTVPNSPAAAGRTSEARSQIESGFEELDKDSHAPEVVHSGLTKLLLMYTGRLGLSLLYLCDLVPLLDHRTKENFTTALRLLSCQEAITATNCVSTRHALDKYPLITKSVSSGLIGVLGDITAQSIEWRTAGGSVPWSGPHEIWRSCAVMIDGFFINGPLLHYAYDVLEDILPAEDNIWAAVAQVGVDVFLIDPVFAFIFVWSTGLVEGRSIERDILHTLEFEYLRMVLWLIVIGLCWAPLQVYLFNRYPVQYRVLVADVIDVVWTCVTSFFSHA